MSVTVKVTFDPSVFLSDSRMVVCGKTELNYFVTKYIMIIILNLTFLRFDFKFAQCYSCFK